MQVFLTSIVLYESIKYATLVFAVSFLDVFTTSLRCVFVLISNPNNTIVYEIGRYTLKKILHKLPKKYKDIKSFIYSQRGETNMKSLYCCFPFCLSLIVALCLVFLGFLQLFYFRFN